MLAPEVIERACEVVGAAANTFAAVFEAVDLTCLDNVLRICS